ncbi:SET domain-containing protein SmydA-8 [Bicyclus anynana]|uniref:SET domain-containing protein SmydA-8 n=1 Tax=Bicyclus anynana TaxID=110368 RepID=A0A6J1NTH5_BICAN|nr:SET domain-containing protein SmydA-8 [Bicyclus anynana]
MVHQTADMTEQEPCEVCSSPTVHKCSSCQAVHYCSRNHQKQHWKLHKQYCVPVRVKEDAKYGRYLEAIRSVKTGEVIMKEAPLITGPSQMTPPVCLGCYKLLEANKTVSCEKCGWPFCSDACTRNVVHAPECYYTQQRGEKVNITNFGTPHPNYQSITVLRCLYQRDNNQKLWAKLQALETHNDDRRGTEKWNYDRKMIAEFIWKFFKLEGKFNEEEIMTCCGIIQINAHEVPLIEPDYVAVYDKVSMVEHSCRANCNKSFASDGQIILSAGVNIPSGSHISVCYTDPLWGTEARRHHLSDTKFFECSCERCSDVTELGTMFSAVKCKKKDCKGYLLPDTFIVPILHKTKSPDPKTRGLDDKFWKCGSCKDEVSDGIIQQLLQDIGRELSVMPKGEPDACERFIGHCSSYLHPSHYYMTDVSLALAQMVGQQCEMGLAGVTEDRLLLKTQLCRKIADLLETLAPAEARLRGSLLFELHAAVAETGRRRSLTDGPGVMLGYITESRKILLESAALLVHEPAELPEGRLGRQARINLLHMDELIQNLSAALPAPL